MRPLNEFYEMIDQRTVDVITMSERRGGFYVSGVFVTLICIIAWVALSYRIVRQKVRDLGQLEEETRHIGEEDHHSAFEIDSNDEIGNLSRAFVPTQTERDRYFDQSLNFLAISGFNGTSNA